MQPLQAPDLIAIGTALGVGSIIPALWKAIKRWGRHDADHEISRLGSLEALVDALRRALDKGRLREDALAQVLGVLIFGLRHIEDLSPVIADAIERAIRILEQAQDRLNHFNDENGK